VFINTVQFPLPSARRCYALGKAVGEAIASWESDQRVVVIGTGGLSHQLDGERAGFINKPFDLKFMDSLVNDPEWVTQYTIHELVEKTGTQGVELLMWLATRGAVPGRVRKVQMSECSLERKRPRMRFGGRRRRGVCCTSRRSKAAVSTTTKPSASTPKAPAC